jgi:hypothetical protein
MLETLPIPVGISRETALEVYRNDVPLLSRSPWKADENVYKQGCSIKSAPPFASAQ